MLDHAKVNAVILYFLNFEKCKSENLMKVKDENEKTKIEKEKSLLRRKFLRQLGLNLVGPFLKEKLKDGTGPHLYIREAILDMLCLIEGEKSCPVNVESPRSSPSVKSNDAGFVLDRVKKGIRLVTVISAVRVFAASIAYLDVLSV